jgi:hypothetical protein
VPIETHLVLDVPLKNLLACRLVRFRPSVIGPNEIARNRPVIVGVGFEKTAGRPQLEQVKLGGDAGVGPVEPGNVFIAGVFRTAETRPTVYVTPAWTSKSPSYEASMKMGASTRNPPNIVTAVMRRPASSTLSRY